MRSFADFIKSFSKIEPLSNFQIIDICNKLKIKNFRGVFMRDELNIPKTNANECMIINIDHSSNDGTHWTCLIKRNAEIIYFDSFGLKPPIEVEKYCDVHSTSTSADTAETTSATTPQRMYNTFQIQNPDDVICGHLCIYVLYKLSNCKADFFTILYELYQYRFR